jgi:hypothetical protein
MTRYSGGFLAAVVLAAAAASTSLASVSSVRLVRVTSPISRGDYATLRARVVPFERHLLDRRLLQERPLNREGPVPEAPAIRPR